jgi:hypothetical protein
MGHRLWSDDCQSGRVLIEGGKEGRGRHRIIFGHAPDGWSRDGRGWPRQPQGTDVMGITVFLGGKAPRIGLY